MRILAVGSIIAAVASLAFASGGWAQQASSGCLSQEVRAQESWYPVGEQVTVIYTLKNTGSSPISYEFPTSQQFDIWVTFGGKEVFRHSRGKMYAQSFTNLTLAPGATKEFRAVWDQRDFNGSVVSSGWFTMHAQLAVKGAPRPYEVSSRIWIGDPQVVIVPMSVGEAVTRYPELVGRSVTISATYVGWQVNTADRNLADGPPLTRSDWVINDATGGMYVSGQTDLDPKQNRGAKVTVTGKLCKTPKGQVYLVVEKVKTS